jgi:O-antigen/teichoic acid export membrane protein
MNLRGGGVCNPQQPPELAVSVMGRRKPGKVAAVASFLARSQLHRIALGLADQGFCAGAMLLVNVMLARTQTKQDYGTFALSYSIYTFLAGLHNAAVLEPYTVYGAGRYSKRFPAYSRLMLRSTAVVGVALAAVLLLTCLLVRWASPETPLRALVGLGLTVGVILWGSFLRRSFYIQRKPAGAAATSLVFFSTVAFSLWLTVRAHLLDSFSVFLILGLGWGVAGAMWFRRPRQGQRPDSFLDAEPHYGREHWKYARWVLAMSFVFQFMHQGYYWLVAVFLSVKDVGDLKAMYALIAPVEQVMISLSFLALPALTARYAARNFAGFMSLWKRYALAMVGITFLFALAVRLLGTAVMHVLYAGKFDGLAPLLFLLALVPLWTGIGNTFSDAIRAAERPRLVFYAYVSSAIATFVLGIPLVIYWGLRGAVYGMSVSGVTYAGALALAFWFYLPRQPAQPWLESFPQSPSRLSPEHSR